MLQNNLQDRLAKVTLFNIITTTKQNEKNKKKKKKALQNFRVKYA